MTINVREINDLIIKDARGVVLQSENKHKIQYDKVMELIAFKMPKLRIVCVAGPSSSGKTTFSKMLHDKLSEAHIGNAVISLDDYFFNKEDIIPEPDGSVDFESVACVDSTLFRRDLESIIKGIPTQVPRYNFHTGLREENYRTITLGERGIVFIEGIHALNYDALFNGGDRDIMLGIYISPEDDYEIDGKIFSRIETRLMRRIVRDVYYRNSSLMNTLKMWESVRKGEMEYIFPFKNNSDIAFNSSLAYEVPVLKDDFLMKYELLSDAEKTVVKSKINTDLIEAFVDLPDNVVPEDSLLNEFILVK
jgi:uridine kinase